MNSGSSARRAQDAANRQEDERRGVIQANSQRVNAIFDDPGRQAQADDLYRATRTYLTDDLTRQTQDVTRQNRFSLARAGLTGGSADVDSNQRIGESYQRGTIEADRRGQAAAANLRASDEQSRLSLLGMVQSGADATTAIAQSNAALQNNLAQNRANATAQGLGDMFVGFSDLYRRSQDEAAERRAQRDVYNLLYQPGFGYGGGRT